MKDSKPMTIRRVILIICAFNIISIFVKGAMEDLWPSFFPKQKYCTCEVKK